MHSGLCRFKNHKINAINSNVTAAPQDELGQSAHEVGLPVAKRRGRLPQFGLWGSSREQKLILVPN
ncbi:MAG: hypothetical protein ABL929_10475, partial [Ferruginibacter sp.]